MADTVQRNATRTVPCLMCGGRDVDMGQSRHNMYSVSSDGTVTSSLSILVNTGSGIVVVKILPY